MPFVKALTRVSLEPMGILDSVKARAKMSVSIEVQVATQPPLERPPCGNPATDGAVCAPEFNLLTTKSKPRALPSGS